MDTFDVNAENRVAAGKGAVKRLKNEGQIPGILYSNGESVPISMPGYELGLILNRHGEDVMLNLHLNGRPIKTKIVEIQRDPVHKDIKHIDLMPLDSDGKIH